MECKNMKIENIPDAEHFFAVIDQCKGVVELVSDEGDRINLKSKLSQFMSIPALFSTGYIRELELVASDPADAERIAAYVAKR